jgi:hypothetical protein
MKINKLDLVGKKKTCCICKNREPKYFMNKVENCIGIKDNIKLKYRKKWICDTCL